MTSRPSETQAAVISGARCWGAHPGHSSILLGDPTEVDGGRFSATDVERLAKHADSNGYLSTSAVGRLSRDAESKCLPIGPCCGSFDRVDEIGDSLFAKLLGRKTERDEVALLEKLTKLAGEDNVIGSASEFGLLFAFLANRTEPDRKNALGIRLEDVEMLVHHQFPEGWENWPKRASDWAHATTHIAASAVKAHLKRKL